MWQGIYKKWNPLPVFENKCFYVEAVHDDWEGFRVWFSSENRNSGVVLIVRFDDILLYVNSNESYRLSKVGNSGEMKFPHLFWKVENSELIKEFNRQSVKIYEDLEIQHFAFLSGDDCVDVLSISEPIFDNKLEDNDILEDELKNQTQ